MSDQTPAPRTGSSGLDPKLGGLLSYAFGWLSGLVIYLVEKENREVRFHAAQSILMSLAFTALWVVISILGRIPFLGILILASGWLVAGLGGFVLWIFMMIKGYNLEHFKLPVIGDVAEDWAARG